MTSKILAFAALVLMCGLCIQAPAQERLPAALETLFAAGVEALKSGDLDAAEKSFQSVLDRGGKTAFVHHNLGVVHQQRGAHERALAHFRAAIKLRPGAGQSHLLAGVSLLALGKPGEAASALQRAVKLLPREPQARLQLARAYERTGNWLGVVDQYRTLGDAEPQNAEYAYQLGRAYNQLSGWSFKQIARIDPNAARLHQSLGQNYLMQGSTELAIASFQRAAAADPRLPEIHLALAMIYLEQKRLDEAGKEIEMELKLAPESKSALEVKRKIEAAKP